MKTSKKIACIGLMMVLRIIELPIFILSAICQIVEIGYSWLATKLVKLSGSKFWIEAFNDGLYNNSMACMKLSDFFDDLEIKDETES